ncbi:hypothetical protein EAI_04153 [Harpegnathos saltator]|uniref:Uncharacterized protein n=1 Tax=Harpegnathos saltator TaxID=610380 RepID=E2BVS7_HARSA|nr:hypothetical protein EAI_04153 [Harpegnathos saltator]
MVCVPCFAIPILLIIWRFLLQPILVKLWRLRSQEKEVKNGEPCPDLVKECKNGTCTLSWKDNQDAVKKDN